MTALAEGSHDYSVFGLRVRSALRLPELFPAGGDGVPDVIIEQGHIPEANGAKPGLNAVDGALLFVIPEVATFRIASGSHIIVDPRPGVAERNVALYLLGSAFGALLHQRGLLPLHANAIQIGGRAVAFMGPSRAGKSTLAAWFQRQGYSIISDDVCVIGFHGDGKPYAIPGLPRLRLWAEALDHLRHDYSGLERSYFGAEEVEKYDVPIDEKSVATENITVAGIYLLDQRDEARIERLEGADAAEAVFANTYRGTFLPATGGEQRHWAAATQLVRSVPVFRASRVWDLGRFDEQNRKLLDHAQQLIAGTLP
jgi:hypothetical protein